MRVALDLDGLTVEFAGPCNEWLAEELGVAPAAIDRWNWYENYYSVTSRTKTKAAWRRFWRMAHDSDWFGQLPIYDGAADGIRTLEDQGHTVFFLTARNPVLRDVTRDWLNRHGFEDLPLLMPGEPKVSVPFDILVDDKVDNVIEAIRHEREAILFRREWNEGELDLVPSKCIAEDWERVIELMRPRPVLPMLISIPGFGGA